MFGSRTGFWGWWIEWPYFRLDQIQDGGRPPYAKILNCHISATGRLIHFMFGSMVGFLGSADQMALLATAANPRSQPAAMLENFELPLSLQPFILRIWF